MSLYSELLTFRKRIRVRFEDYFQYDGHSRRFICAVFLFVTLVNSVSNFVPVSDRKKCNRKAR